MAIVSTELVFKQNVGTTEKRYNNHLLQNKEYRPLKNIKMNHQRKYKKNLLNTAFQRQQFPITYSPFSLRANILVVSVAFILYFTLNPTTSSVEACLCHLIPNFKCPPPPPCCESGQYAKDECGCCLTCAKSELQPCGGPSGAHGKCSSGLQCLKTCSKYNSDIRCK